MEIDDKVTSFEAQAIIEALRKGTVPSQSLELLSRGRQFWFDAVKEDLEFIKRGGSKIRFVSAAYGGGKTHFCYMIKDEALSQDFVLSYVELHSREAPLDKFEVIFTKIMRGIVTSESEYGLEDIFNRWIENFDVYDKQEIESTLKELAPSMDFRAALRSYLESRSLDSLESEDHSLEILGWLRGNKISASFSNRTGIRNSISISNVSEVFGLLLKFIRHNSYSGLVLLLDEAEAVTSLARSRRRDEANQNIRKLLDNAEQHMGLYILFSTTPKFLNDTDVGAQSYPALWQRIKDVLDVNLKYPNKRNTVIPLEPLETKDLLALANTIVSIHERAYGWKASDTFGQDVNRAYVRKFQDSTEDHIIRTFIRGIVSLLDIAEQDTVSIPDEIDKLHFQEY